MELFYDAYRKFGEIMSDKSMQFCFSLQPGECFIVDNTKNLHARNERYVMMAIMLQGCYSIKMDYYLNMKF